MKYEAIKCSFSVRIAGQPALPLQPFCAALVGGGGHPHVSSPV